MRYLPRLSYWLGAKTGPLSPPPTRMSLNFHQSSRIGFHSAICLAEYNLATEWHERRNRVERSEVEEEEEEATWLQSCKCSRYLRTLHTAHHPIPRHLPSC